MKIVVDTNVLISATFWAGDSDRILEKAENKEIELVLSKEIIEEFVRVLGYEEIQQKIKDKNLEMRRTAEKIASISTIVVLLQKLDVIKEDSDDNKILECAVEGNADYIVSQDNHLLNLKEFRGIKIVTPEEFLDVLRR